MNKKRYYFFISAGIIFGFYDIQSNNKKRKKPENGFNEKSKEKRQRTSEMHPLEALSDTLQSYIDNDNYDGIHSIMRFGIISSPLIDSVQPIAYAVNKGKINALKIFIEDYNLPCSTGYFSPFHNALMKGNIKICDYFIEHFCITIDRPLDPYEGSTPLHIAAAYGNVPLFKMLVKKQNASPLIFDKNGKSAVAILADIPLSTEQQSLETKKYDMLLWLLHEELITIRSVIVKDGISLREYAKKNENLLSVLKSYKYSKKQR